MSRVLLALGMFAATTFGSQLAHAETPAEILATFKTEAASTAGFQGFNAARGETFFKSKHGGEWSCSSCHTDHPENEGKHAKTDKLIKPMAPVANAERFTEVKKVAKWFKRNCNDVLDRECTAQEKGDVMSYLLAVGTKQVAAPAAIPAVIESKPAATLPVVATKPAVKQPVVAKPTTTKPVVAVKTSSKVESAKVAAKTKKCADKIVTPKQAS